MSRKKYINLAAGFILLLFVGLIYSWSIFVNPLEDEFKWTRDQTSLIFVISIISYNTGSIFCGFLLKKYSEKHVLLLAMLLLSTGFMGASFINYIGQLYLCYGILCGMGIGLTYNVIVTTVLTWFADKPGMASGILLMGYGSGGFLFSPLISLLLYSDIGWRGSFRILAAAFFVIIAIGGCIIQKAPVRKQITNRASGTRENIMDKNSKEMMKTPFFRFFFPWLVFLGTIGMTVISSGALMAIDINATVFEASLTVGILSVGNGLGRIIYGKLCDLLEGDKVLFLSTLSSMISAILLFIAMNIGSLPLLSLTFCLTGMSYGSLPVLIAYFCRTMYGPTYMSMNLAILSMNGILTSLIGSYGAGVVYTLNGTYTLVLYILIALSLIAMLCLLWYKLKFMDHVDIR